MRESWYTHQSRFYITFNSVDLKKKLSMFYSFLNFLNRTQIALVNYWNKNVLWIKQTWLLWMSAFIYFCILFANIFTYMCLADTGTMWMSFSWWKNNDNLEHIHSEILFSSKEKELESIIVSEVTPTQKDECQYSLSSVVLSFKSSDVSIQPGVTTDIRKVKRDHRMWG